MTGRELIRVVAAALAVATAGGAAGAAAAAAGAPAAGPAGIPGARESAPIVAPDTVDAGQTINVVVEGAPRGSRIELWGPVSEAGRGELISASPLVGGTARLDAPRIPASYEIRYIGAGDVLHARRPFDVAAVPVTLSVMTPVDPGGQLDVTWQGPAQPGDRFEIVSASGAVVGSTPIAGDSSGRNVSQVTAPQERGGYELRYVTDRGAVLRWVRFDVQ